MALFGLPTTSMAYRSIQDIMDVAQRAAQHSSSLHEPLTAPVVPRVSAANAQRQILVIDDDASIQLLLRRTLERAGFDVMVAGSKQEGLAWISGREMSVDLVLCDVNGREPYGASFIAQLREANAAVPIIVMSGYSEAHVMGNLFGIRRVSFLAKPFRIGDLVERVSSSLDELSERERE